MHELTTYEKITGTIAKWIVVNIASRINATAVVSLCYETVRLYDEKRNA